LSADDVLPTDVLDAAAAADDDDNDDDVGTGCHAFLLSLQHVKSQANKAITISSTAETNNYRHTEGDFRLLFYKNDQGYFNLSRQIVLIHTYCC